MRRHLEMRLSGLETERQNRFSADLDKMSALEIAALMNREDAKVLQAVRKALPAIAKAIDVVRDRLAKGGRLIYVGSGTSGRIGALDALECPPTFGTDPAIIQYLIAGGDYALANASESSEDSAEQGVSDIASRRPGKKDVVVGLAASGRTPYTVAALKYARKKGAATIAIVCNTGSDLAKVAQLAIEADVGPEVLTGSTRLKAGTAEKMICNMLTTGAMARLGYVYGNLMVNLHLRNQKLIERGISIVRRVAKVDRTVALDTLEAADRKVPVALVMLCAQVTHAEAARRLKRAKGSVRKAIEA
jgi:N-acetylmuramic acid 6-phosphate etherase